jgi:hypothetical protein
MTKKHYDLSAEEKCGTNNFSRYSSTYDARVRGVYLDDTVKIARGEVGNRRAKAHGVEV